MSHGFYSQTPYQQYPPQPYPQQHPRPTHRRPQRPRATFQPTRARPRSLVQPHNHTHKAPILLSHIPPMGNSRHHRNKHRSLRLQTHQQQPPRQRQAIRLSQQPLNNPRHLRPDSPISTRTLSSCLSFYCWVLALYISSQHAQPAQSPYGAPPPAAVPQDYAQSLGQRALPPPARSATVGSYPTGVSLLNPEFGQRASAASSLNRHSAFVPPVFGSRARSASPLPPSAIGDIARAPTTVSAKSLDSGLVNGRPLPYPGMSMTGSLPSVRERASVYEGSPKKDFTYPAKPRCSQHTLVPLRSLRTQFSPKPTYAAQPSVNPRTVPFDPFGASSLSSSPPKVPPPARASIPPPSLPAAPSWPQEKKPDLPLNLPISISTPSGSGSKFGTGQRAAPPFGATYERSPSLLFQPIPPKELPLALLRQEWGRERDRAEDAIARAREVGRSFLKEQGVAETKSEAATIAEEYLARRARESLARAGGSPERPGQISNAYSAAPPTSSYSSAPSTTASFAKSPPTRRFQSPERRPNDKWAPSSPSRKDRWGEPQGIMLIIGIGNHLPGGPTRPSERPWIPRASNEPLNNPPAPKSRSQRAFPSDGDYVEHRERDSFRQNGSSPTRHQAYASEPTRSPSRGDEYDEYPEEYDDRPALQGMSRRERDEVDYERRSPERAPPRTNHEAPRAQPRPEPRSTPRDPPAVNLGHNLNLNLDPSLGPKHAHSLNHKHNPRPPQGQSPVTSPRATPPQPAVAPRQSMAMRFAAQALADEGKPWPNDVPQLPRGPGQPKPDMRRQPAHAPPPSEPPSETDLEDEYEYEQEQEWREPTPVPARRQPAPASPRREPHPQPRREPQQREYIATPPRREQTAMLPRSEPARARPPPQQPVYQEDRYEQYEYDDEPPQQEWRQPEEKPKPVQQAPKREPLRETHKSSPNEITFKPARKETSREAALRRPVPPPRPAPAPAPAPAPRTPSPAQTQVPTITFGDEQEYEPEPEPEPEPAPGVPTFSFDMADEPAGPVVNVSEPYEPEPTGPRIQVDEVPSISVIEDSAPRVMSQHEERGESPVRRGGGLRCAGCDGAIAGRIVSAMGVRWHPHCFKCADCGTLLEHVSSYEHEGKAYCHLDYHDRFAPRCYHCKTAIVDERFIALDDPALGGQRYYHELHFFCAECGDPFLDPNASSAAPPAARVKSSERVTGMMMLDLQYSTVMLIASRVMSDFVCRVVDRAPSRVELVLQELGAVARLERKRLKRWEGNGTGNALLVT
ncbi:paxillin [Ceratobasidium sp. AG-Ba]|nr:paxillin [Ceratobasidium sp. AG-Ba]